MSFYNRIKHVSQDFEWPSEQIHVIETTSGTDAEGSISINYSPLLSIDTTDIKIFLATAPMVPATQYTKTGINLYTGTQFKITNKATTEGTKVRFTLDWVFKTILIGASSGEFYTVEIDLNNIINITFIVKIKDLVA